MLLLMPGTYDRQGCRHASRLRQIIYHRLNHDILKQGLILPDKNVEVMK